MFTRKPFVSLLVSSLPLSSLSISSVLVSAVLVPAWAAFSFAQQTSSLPAASVVREFPMVFESNVVAGKTPAGTKIQARLSIATLQEGSVIPRNALFTGEVIESVSRTATEASRLAIRMDSAQWKNGSAAVKLYLTAWYYPTVAEAGQNLQYGPAQPANRTWNGQGQYPDPNSRSYKPFPGSDSDSNASNSDVPSSVTSNHRVAMANVESERSSDGTITITSHKANLKLDKLTTYVLAAGDLPAAPASAPAK
jgi:hypothetical protein